MGRKIDLDHFVPEFVGMLGSRVTPDHACSVDKDIDDRVVGAHLFRECMNGVSIGEIAAIGEKPPSGASDCIPGVPAIVLHRRAHTDDVRAGSGKRFRHAAADAATGSRDERGLPGKVEQFGDVAHVSSA